VTEDVGDLKRARDPQARALIGRQRGDLAVAEPSLGGSSPESRLKKVVFPAPFGPMIVRTPPSGISIVTSLTAVKPENRRVNRSVRNTGVVAAGAAGAAGALTARPFR
jgi:hypothetical protein